MEYLEKNKIITISLDNYNLKIKYDNKEYSFYIRILFTNRNENTK